MNSIQIMMDEHQNILRMLKVVRKLCLKVLHDETIDYNNFYMVIDFVRNYADKHHHSKEEDILFKELKIHLNEENRLGPVTGMFIEHDTGRLYMQNLEKALKKYEAGHEDAKLDIIANCICYTDLLRGHIDKEDNAIYPLAQKSLSESVLNKVESLSSKVEELATEGKLQAKYIKILEELEDLVA